MITRKDISVPEFYKGYINSVKEDDQREFGRRLCAVGRGLVLIKPDKRAVRGGQGARYLLGVQ